MYRSFNTICQSLLIYMVQFTSGQTTLPKTTRDTNARRDGTSDEGRFYGWSSLKQRIGFDVLFLESTLCR